MGIMSLTSSRRGNALLLVVAVSLLSVLCAVPSVQATPRTIEPAAAITVTLVLNQAAYLSGDVAIATALVYRTPWPANYTYNWTVRDTFGRIVNTTLYGVSKFTYPIPLNHTGRLTFSVRVDDGQGLTSSAQSTVTVFVAVMSLRLDRGDFTPGDAITASYSVTSHVILRPTYDYQVADSSLTIVLSGNTNNTTFSFRTPAPASRTYRFLVTASAGTNTSQPHLPIPQGVGTGELVVIATESSTGTAIGHTLHIGTTNALWSTDIGGVPLFAVLLGLLFILLFVAVLGLWRRVGGGHLMGPRAAPPPPPPGDTTQAPTTMPMSVICSHCGKSIDLTTSKRPIEVMCPSCGETQTVA